MTDGEVKDDGKKKEVTKGDGEVILKEIVVPPVPDKEGTLSRQKEIQKEISKLEKDRDELKSQISLAKDSKNGNKEEVDEKLAEVNALKAKKQGLNEESISLKNAMDKATKNVVDMIEKSKNLRGTMKATSSTEIDNRIRALEKRQSTTSMTLTEEKNLLKEITTLQQTKTLAAELDNIDADIKSLKSIKNDSLKAYDAKMKELKAVTALYQSKNKEIDGLMKTRKKIWNIAEQIKVKRNKIDKDWKAYEATLKEYQKYQRAEKARKEKELKKERAAAKEKQRKEAEAARKREEEEELKKPPYQEEQQLCNTLITRIKALQPKDLNNDDSSAISSSSTTAGFDGMTVLNRKQEDFMGGVGKKHKKKGKKTKTALPYDITMIENFKLLDLIAPSAVTEIEASIAALEDKKATFAKTERGAIKTLRDKRNAIEDAQKVAEKAAEKAAAAAANNNNNNNNNNNKDRVSKDGTDKVEDKKPKDNKKDSEKTTKANTKTVFNLAEDFPAL